jgi:methylated-DNA-protein-cysteine methyltransferase related protein
MTVTRATQSQPPSGDEALRRIWTVVAAIPRGTVTYYGEVARRAGLPGRARLVGRALKVAPRGLKLPWHRVLAASGRPAFPAGSDDCERQLKLLGREGVSHRNGRVQLKRSEDSESLDALLWGGRD